MANVLESLSADMAQAVERAGSSLVRIQARRRQSATGIVWSADGLIVTAHHVVEREEGIRIGLPDGSQTTAVLVGRDPTTDIAVLRAESSGLTPAAWAELDEVRVGHLVLAVGRPDAGVQATLGVISALDGGWRTMAGGAVDAYVQTDVVMYPGFSGGALVGANGACIGMNSSALVRGVSVTLPAATLRRVADSLKVHGRVKRGFLGVNAQGVRLPQSLAEKLGQETGLLLAAVEQGSPAELGGLMVGDILVAVDGQAVRQMDDLMAALSGDRVGKTVPVTYVRGGQPAEATVAVGERTA
ncbi:MAG TPA: trypsin-like peptidase domain-containing protein [Candidatus Limnocylindrales bacterium]|nr:trypsin-like peptidase domain-containing protein [Candidatus Limnocylindrales bacterium]